MSDAPRPKTKDEVREEFLEAVRQIARYWPMTNRDRAEICDGVAFSILVILDGGNVNLPAFDLILHPHPNDKEFYKKNGENWYETGMAINDDVALHELWHKEQDEHSNSN